MVHEGESGIRSVQIAGADPQLMAEAAQSAMTAQIIDINMGCPAKKVNKKLAGSARICAHPELIKDNLRAVVNAVDVPVTLKTRTGWDTDNRNCVQIAKIAEDCGIQAPCPSRRTFALVCTKVRQNTNTLKQQNKQYLFRLSPT